LNGENYSFDPWCSWADEKGYCIPSDNEGIHMLTNKKCDQHYGGRLRSDFKITELEVWGVKFSE
jgi:hypothetical protein